jgi:hypothetical protein
VDLLLLRLASIVAEEAILRIARVQSYIFKLQLWQLTLVGFVSISDLVKAVL